MSVQTLYTAATGMGAMETKLDVIANNLANLNTTAFKAERANFEDLFYRNYTRLQHANQLRPRRLCHDEQPTRLGDQWRRVLSGHRYERPDGLHAGRQFFH